MAIVKVQAEPFNPQEEATRLVEGRVEIGALVTFTGLVRQDPGDGTLESLILEHYPAMTERKIEAIANEAESRWPLQACLVIHRYGRLDPGNPIVFVATASAHRRAAFEAADFLMDWLKTKAPFWKQEIRSGDNRWVDARDADDRAAERWSRKKT